MQRFTSVREDVDSTRRLHILAPHKLRFRSQGIRLRITLVGDCACRYINDRDRDASASAPGIGADRCLALSNGMSRGWVTLGRIPNLMIDDSFLRQKSGWEMFSIIRWWLLYGAIAIAWLAIRLPLGRRWKIESARECLSRFLAFGPWLVVLDIAFLVGIWTRFANSSPNQARCFPMASLLGISGTGIVGVVRTGLFAALVPSLLVSSLFFRWVLRWSWFPAVAAAACLVPATLLWSIAWSVAYLNWVATKLL